MPSGESHSLSNPEHTSLSYTLRAHMKGCSVVAEDTADTTQNDDLDVAIVTLI